MNLEKFESRIGSIMAVLGVIWIPVPFVGIFTLLQFIVFLSISFLKLNDPAQIVYQLSIFLIPLIFIFFVLGVYAMIKYNKYKSPGLWIRLVCYIFSIIFHICFYLLYIRGPVTY